MNETDIWARECLRTISIVNEWSEDRIIKLILACQDVSDDELDLAIEAGGIRHSLRCTDCDGFGYYATGDTDNPTQTECERCSGRGIIIRSSE